MLKMAFLKVQTETDFDTFFAYAKITAPELTDWITSDTEPAVRAYFNAISSYDGFYDSGATYSDQHS